MLVQDGIDAGLLPAYSAGFIHLDKQFSTLGVNGLNEAAEERGLTVGNNKEYKEWVAEVLGTFKRLNAEARTLYNGAKYNTECVPSL
jgi:ribonucleoside-triphosphate reductase